MPKLSTRQCYLFRRYSENLQQLRHFLAKSGLAGEKFCSAGNLKVCSNSGTWGLQTCPNGCENNACKPKPTPAPTVATAKIDPFANLAGLGTYGLAGNTAIPLPQSAVTSQEGFNQWQGSVFSGLGTGLAAGSAALGGAALLPAGGLPVAALMAQNTLAGSSTLQTAAAVATLSQFPASIIACQTQGADSPACQMGAAGITSGLFTDPIGTFQSLQTSAQQVQSVAQQGLTELSFASSILNLPNADNSAGWTLGTYGRQTNVIQPQKTVAGINQEIDKLVANGVDKLEAIRQVGSVSVPDYAATPEQIAQLQLADKARTADEILQCPYTWCRHNSTVSDAILESRGYQPYRAAMMMQTTEGLSAGGHQVSAIIVNGEPVFIDLTNNLIIPGQQALEQILLNSGKQLTALEMIRLTTNNVWDVINLIPK